MRSPPPPREFVQTPQFGRALLDAVYYLWHRVSQSYYQVGDSTIYTGAGSPENAQVGNIGDLYLRTDGGAGTTLYVKEADAGLDTGWAAK